MAHNVKKEFELYEPMQYWLKNYLNDRYRGAQVITIDAHARTLDSFLEENGIIDQYPQTIGLDIQIDVLGLVSRKGKTDIVFIEAKKTQLNLHDLGQLWAYCKLCKPLEHFRRPCAPVLLAHVRAVDEKDIRLFSFCSEC